MQGLQAANKLLHERHAPREVSEALNKFSQILASHLAALVNAQAAQAVELPASDSLANMQQVLHAASAYASSCARQSSLDKHFAAAVQQVFEHNLAHAQQPLSLPYYAQMLDLAAHFDEGGALLHAVRLRRAAGDKAGEALQRAVLEFERHTACRGDAAQQDLLAWYQTIQHCRAHGGYSYALVAALGTLPPPASHTHGAAFEVLWRQSSLPALQAAEPNEAGSPAFGQSQCPVLLWPHVGAESPVDTIATLVVHMLMPYASASQHSPQRLVASLRSDVPSHAWLCVIRAYEALHAFQHEPCGRVEQLVLAQALVAQSTGLRAAPASAAAAARAEDAADTPEHGLAAAAGMRLQEAVAQRNITSAATSASAAAASKSRPRQVAPRAVSVPAAPLPLAPDPFAEIAAQEALVVPLPGMPDVQLNIGLVVAAEAVLRHERGGNDTLPYFSVLYSFPVLSTQPPMQQVLEEQIAPHLPIAGEVAQQLLGSASVTARLRALPQLRRAAASADPRWKDSEGDLRGLHSLQMARWQALHECLQAVFAHFSSAIGQPEAALLRHLPARAEMPACARDAKDIFARQAHLQQSLALAAVAEQLSARGMSQVAQLPQGTQAFKRFHRLIASDGSVPASSDWRVNVVQAVARHRTRIATNISAVDIAYQCLRMMGALQDRSPSQHNAGSEPGQAPASTLQQLLKRVRLHMPSTQAGAPQRQAALQPFNGPTPAQRAGSNGVHGGSAGESRAVAPYSGSPSSASRHIEQPVATEASSVHSAVSCDWLPRCATAASQFVLPAPLQQRVQQYYDKLEWSRTHSEGGTHTWRKSAQDREYTVSSVQVSRCSMKRS